jgi:hypothetical protein
MTEEESKAYDSVLNGNYTIPRGYYSKMKYYGINLQKGFIVFGAFMLAVQTQNVLFPTEQFLQFVLFVILFTTLVFYLVLPTRTGGTNVNAIWYFLTHRNKRYFPIDRGTYPEFHGGVDRKNRKRFGR